MRDHILFAVVALVWGFSFLLMKWATAAFEPLTLAGWRVVGGAVALIVVAAVVRHSWRPQGRQWLLLLPILLGGYLVPFTIQPWLIARYDTSFVGLLPSLVPLCTLAAMLVLLRRRPSPRQLLGVVGGLVCLVCLSLDGLQRSVAPAHMALGLLVPSGYAISNTLVKRWFSDQPVMPLTAWCLGLSAVVLVPSGHGSETVRTEHLPAAIIAVAALGVVSTGLVLGCFYHLIQRRGPLYAGMVTYLIPMGAMFWGWVIGETISVLQALAVGGVVVMVVMTQAGAKQEQGEPA